MAGTLFFIDPKVEWAFHIDIFVANTFTGQITEYEPRLFISRKQYSNLAIAPLPVDLRK